MSIMLVRESAGHSIKVRRLRFEVTTVKGPVGCDSVCFVYRLMRDLIKVVFPTCQELVKSCE